MNVQGQAGPSLGARFDLALTGDWSVLIDLWRSDLLRLENKEALRQNVPRPAQSEEKLREQILEKISSGQISRAARRVESHGIADLNKTPTKNALQLKFPARCLENIIEDAMLQI